MKKFEGSYYRPNKVLNRENRYKLIKRTVEQRKANISWKIKEALLDRAIPWYDTYCTSIIHWKKTDGNSGQRKKYWYPSMHRLKGIKE